VQDLKVLPNANNNAFSSLSIGPHCDLPYSSLSWLDKFLFVFLKK